MVVRMFAILTIAGIARAQNALSQAKTGCPRDSGSLTEYSDIDGDCECPEGTECVMDGSFESGCPFSGSNENNEGGFNTGIKFFSPSCRLCSCQVKTHRGCPESSMSLTPDPEGNCFCSTEGDTMCYTASNATWPGCDIFPKLNATMPLGAVRFNETGLFRSDCDDCICQPPRYSPANRLTDDEQHCNAAEPQCLVSGSLDVAHVCPGGPQWEKCCDRDVHGCARGCCGVLPAYVVVLIALGCLTAVLTPVLLCYFYSKAHPNKVSQEDGELELPDGRRVSMVELHGHITSPGGSRPARPKSAAARFAASAVAGLMPATNRPSTARRREEGAASLPPVRAVPPLQQQQRPQSSARPYSGRTPPRPVSGGAPRPLSGGRLMPVGARPRPLGPRGGAVVTASGGRQGVMPRPLASGGAIPRGSYGSAQQRQQLQNSNQVAETEFARPHRDSAPPEHGDVAFPASLEDGGGARSRPVSAAASMRSSSSSSSRPASAASNKRWSGLLEPAEGLQEALPIEHAHFGDQYGGSSAHGGNVGGGGGGGSGLGGSRLQSPMSEESSSSSDSDDDGPPDLRPRTSASSQMVSPSRKGSWSGVLSPGGGLQQ